MPISRTWFAACAECADPDVCAQASECAEGYDCEQAAGFDFTQESEDRHNDNRR